MKEPSISRSRAAALMFAGVVGAAGAATRPVRAQSAPTIRLATLPIDTGAEPFYAKEMDFFSKGRLNADVQIMNSGPAIAAAVTSNAVDVGLATIDTVASIHVNNVPIVVIAPASQFVSAVDQGVAALVVPENSTARVAKDLNGKTIASSALKTLQETAARAWIDAHGGDSSTVKFVELPFPAMPAALESGRVDGAWIAEPFIELAKRHGRVLTEGFDSIGKHFLISAWITTPQWAKEHSDLVRSFGSVMRETAAWANKNHPKTAEILTHYTKIDPAVLATMVRADYADQLTPALVQPLIDVSAKYNGFRTFPAAEIIFAPAA